jgi:hypothetical protein
MFSLLSIFAFFLIAALFFLPLSGGIGYLLYRLRIKSASSFTISLVIFWCVLAGNVVYCWTIFYFSNELKLVTKQDYLVLLTVSFALSVLLALFTLIRIKLAQYRCIQPTKGLRQAVGDIFFMIVFYSLIIMFLFRALIVIFSR